MVQRIERLETLLFESSTSLERSSPDGRDQAADEQLTKQLSTLMVNDPGDSQYWGAVVTFPFGRNIAYASVPRCFIRFLTVLATRIGVDT